MRAFLSSFCGCSIVTDQNSFVLICFVTDFDVVLSGFVSVLFVLCLFLY